MAITLTVIRNSFEQTYRADELADWYADLFASYIGGGSGGGGASGSVVTTDNFDLSLVPEDPFVPKDGNLPPIAVDDVAETDEDTQVVIDVLANDSDPDGDQLYISGLLGFVSGGGVASETEDGKILFSPAGDFDSLAKDETAVVTIPYTITDGHGAFDTAEVTVTITGVDDATFSVEATDTDKPEGNTGITPMVFTVRREGDLTTSASVVATLVHVPPSGQSSDLEFLGPTVNQIDFAAGESEQTITVNVFANRLPEDDLELRVELSEPTVSNGNAVIEDAQATGILSDDDSVISDDIEGTSSNDKIRGSTDNDVMIGGEGNDRLVGLSGDDLLFGDGGGDVLVGRDGVDTLVGGEGNDRLSGGRDDDILAGDDGNDVARGGQGNDILFGGSGDDRLFGQRDNDTIFGDEGDDRIFGQHGDDLLSGDAGTDLLVGGAGNDALIGGLGNDILRGGRGDDVLVADEGDDRLIGGGGSDILSLFADGDDVVVGLKLRQGDRLDVRQLSEINTLDDFLDRTEAEGRNAVFTADNGATTTFLRFNADTLSEDDFIFA